MDSLADPRFVLIVRLIVGGFVLVAGLSKVHALSDSARAVAAYQIVPRPVARVVGYSLPWVEVVLGGLLLLGAQIAAVLGSEV